MASVRVFLRRTVLIVALAVLAAKNKQDNGTDDRQASPKDVPAALADIVHTAHKYGQTGENKSKGDQISQAGKPGSLGYCNQATGNRCGHKIDNNLTDLESPVFGTGSTTGKAGILAEDRLGSRHKIVTLECVVHDM